jgi:hypothetical protein
VISQVEIVNNALIHLGKSTIEAMDDGSPEAEKMDAVYNSALKAALRAAPWQFAKRVQYLGEIADEEDEFYDYLYQYPSACLNILSVYSEGTDRTKVITEDYKLRQSPDTGQKAIATNIEDALIEYTTLVTDPNFFDSLFVDLLALELAERTAISLTGNLKILDKVQGMKIVKEGEAKRVNHSEAPETAKRISPTQTARGN